MCVLGLVLVMNMLFGRWFSESWWTDSSGCAQMSHDRVHVRTLAFLYERISGNSGDTSSTRGDQATLTRAGFGREMERGCRWCVGSVSWWLTAALTQSGTRFSTSSRSLASTSASAPFHDKIPLFHGPSEAIRTQQNEADGDDTECNKLQADREKCKNTLHVAASILSCYGTRIKMRMPLGFKQVPLVAKEAIETRGNGFCSTGGVEWGIQSREQRGSATMRTSESIRLRRWHALTSDMMKQHSRDDVEVAGERHGIGGPRGWRTHRRREVVRIARLLCSGVAMAERVHPGPGLG